MSIAWQSLLNQVRQRNRMAFFRLQALLPTFADKISYFMRPLLAVGPLTNLQDARSCAAVGVDYLVFSLERGSMRMLASNLIWSMVSWIAGPQVVLELSVDSMQELDSLGGSVEIGAISLPWQDWTNQTLPGREVWLRATENDSVSAITSVLEKGNQDGNEIRIIVSCEAAPAVWEEWASHLWLHFGSLEQAQAFIRESSWMPTGILLGAEAEESFGMLDYEAMDELIEMLDARFPAA